MTEPHSLSTETPRTILVTGAAGFIGSHLVERLLARGDRVIGVDNFDLFYAQADKHRNLAGVRDNARFRLIVADCQDLESLRRDLSDQRLDGIIHLAAKAGVRPSIEDPIGYSLANVVGTQSMLELARTMGVRRFVFASSSSVYGNNAKVPFAEDDAVNEPISPYAATKRAGELLCHTYHHLYAMSIVSLRFFTVYGPRQRPDLAIRKFGTLMLAAQPIPMFGDGSTARDYTWIDDIIDGVVAAFDLTEVSSAKFLILNLGGSKTTTLSRLVDLLGEALSVRPTIQPLPLQPGDVARTYADVSRAETVLGYRPRTPIEQGIRKFATWLEAHQRELPPLP